MNLTEYMNNAQSVQVINQNIQYSQQLIPHILSGGLQQYQNQGQVLLTMSTFCYKLCQWGYVTSRNCNNSASGGMWLAGIVTTSPSGPPSSANLGGGVHRSPAVPPPSQRLPPSRSPWPSSRYKIVILSMFDFDHHFAFSTLFLKGPLTKTV